MTAENNAIKNPEIYRQIDKRTENDPVMRSFLREIVGMGAIYTYKKKYDDAIDKALEDKGYQP